MQFGYKGEVSVRKTPRALAHVKSRVERQQEWGTKGREPAGAGWGEGTTSAPSVHSLLPLEGCLHNRKSCKVFVFMELTFY